MQQEVPKTLRKWEKTRRKGLLRFILVRGVISFAVFMFLWAWFFTRGERPSTWFEAVRIYLAAAAVGFIWATLVWILMEEKYAKYKGSREL